MFASPLKTIYRFLLIACVGLGLFAPAHAAADKDTIKSIIESQLNAFAADDGRCGSQAGADHRPAGRDRGHADL